MPINPNNLFKARNDMMTGWQRINIEEQCRKYDISLITLTTRALGHRKKTSELTFTDAARCIMAVAVWGNLRKRGYVS